MKIGTYYYPEQWPREHWRRDFDNIAAMGLQIVHMAEFAWFSLEPSAGEFKFDWLIECVEMAHQRKLDVILCTPTASPPSWLIAQHPEILPMTETGNPWRFGGRRHYNPLSQPFINATRRIVTAMADRFGNHPAVIGWQIDNEFSQLFDQSATTHDAFQKWLRNKYGDITELNRAWACQFWNTQYTEFSQIQFPPGRDPKYGNPHQSLDASRFWSWAFAQYNKVQTEILKPRIGDRFITTNFMHFHPDCDPSDMADDLTLMSWDSYPVTGWDAVKDSENYRIGDPASIGCIHDYMAGFHNRWALMEMQPGQINWSGIPVQVYPGAIRLWLWTAFAHGAEFVTTYRYRQPRFGIEMFHHGLVGTDGVTPSPGGIQFSQVIGEIAKLDLSRVPTLAEEPFDPSSTVGLMFDFEQNWWYATLPQSRRWNQTRWLLMWYAAISRLGLKIRVIRPDGDWPEGMKMLVAPGVQMVDDALVKRWRDYAEGGGNLVLTCRTALMDRTGQMWEGPTAQPIVSLIGASIESYDGLPENIVGRLSMDEDEFEWGVWGDQLSPTDGTQTLAVYTDQFYCGKAAVTRVQRGNGSVTYCGVYSELPLIDSLVEKLASDAGLNGLKITALPSRTQLLRRGPYHILLNFQDSRVEAPAPAGATFIVGSRDVGPADVAVWME